MGELVTETFEYGGRQVRVYLPPDPPEVVVFAGDAQLISDWGGHLEVYDAEVGVGPQDTPSVHLRALRGALITANEPTPEEG